MGKQRRTARQKFSGISQQNARNAAHDDHLDADTWPDRGEAIAAGAVIVRRYGDTSATVRRVLPSEAPVKSRAKLEPIDLVIQALAQVRGALAQQTWQTETVKAQVDAGGAFGWLDALAQAQSEATFPLPSSPRYGLRGGPRVAEDGSPGLPPSWMRWLARPSFLAALSGGASALRSPVALDADGAVESVADHMGAQVLTLAVERVARRAPSSWRIYREYVTAGDPSIAATAARLRLSAPLARREVARVRAALVTEIAYLSGLIDAQDTQATQDALTLYASSLSSSSAPAALPTAATTRPDAKPDARAQGDMR